MTHEACGGAAENEADDPVSGGWGLTSVDGRLRLVPPAGTDAARARGCTCWIGPMSAISTVYHCVPDGNCPLHGPRQGLTGGEE